MFCDVLSGDKVTCFLLYLHKNITTTLIILRNVFTHTHRSIVITVIRHMTCVQKIKKNLLEEGKNKNIVVELYRS